METAYDMAAALARYLFIMIMLYVIIASAVLSIKEARIMRAARKRARLSVRYIEMLAPDDVRGKRFYLNGAYFYSFSLIRLMLGWENIL